MSHAIWHMVRVEWLEAPERQLVDEIEVGSVCMTGGQQDCGGKHVGEDHATGESSHDSMTQNNNNDNNDDNNNNNNNDSNNDDNHSNNNNNNST